MQTFVTEVSLSDNDQPFVAMHTARHLDRARLGKQRLEAKQILQALNSGRGWVNHPATHMWRGHQEALAYYGYLMCNEYASRGYEDNLGNWFYNKASVTCDWPWWLGRAEMVAAHRSKLIRKDPDHYKAKFAHDRTANEFVLPYLWPVAEEPGRFLISNAEMGRIGQWAVPSHWRVNKATRAVTFGDEQRWNRAKDDGVFYG